MVERMRQTSEEDGIKGDVVPGPSIRKWKQEDCNADNEDSGVQSHHLVKKTKTDVIQSESEEESKERRDWKEDEPNYCSEEDEEDEEYVASNACRSAVFWLCRFQFTQRLM